MLGYNEYIYIIDRCFRVDFMKRIMMTLMMTFMAFFVSAACVFAETESENGIDPYDITKWNIHLDKT